MHNGSFIGVLFDHGLLLASGVICRNAHFFNDHSTLSFNASRCAHKFDFLNDRVLSERDDSFRCPVADDLAKSVQNHSHRLGASVCHKCLIVHSLLDESMTECKVLFCRHFSEI